MGNIRSRLLAGVLTFTVLGQTLVLPVHAGESTSGNEDEGVAAAAEGNVLSAEPEGTGTDTDSEEAAEESSASGADPAADQDFETGNSGADEEISGSETADQDASTEITGSETSDQNTSAGLSAESETDNSETDNSEADDDTALGAEYALRLYDEAAASGAPVLETGGEFSEDIGGLVGDLSEIRSLVITAEAPTGSYVDVGERHHHSAECYHQHNAECTTTVEITRSFDSLTGLGAVYVNNNAVSCGCGSGGHAVNYVATIHEVRTVNGVVVSDEHLTSQTNVGCGNCISENYGIGTHTETQYSCGMTSETLICGKTDEEHLYHVYAYCTDGVLYLYDPSDSGENVVFNADSAGMFAGMSGLDSLDLTGFDGTQLLDTTNMFPAELEALTLNETFRFSDSSGTYATQGSGLADAWEKDGEEVYDGDTAAPFKTQKTYNTSLLSGTFEGRWNENAKTFAGTWIRNSETHSYLARGQAATTPGGNAWEEHNPDKRFYGYCFAQHLESPNGRYDKILVDDLNILTELLNGQHYQSAPAADNIRDALVTVLYYGYPNDKAGIEKKYGLSDSEYAQVTWDVLRFYSDGMVKSGSSGEAADNAYDELCSMTYDSIPQALKENLHLYIYVSEQHQEHMVAIDGVNYENYGGVSVLKQDAETGMPLEGAEFTIYDSDGNAVDADKETEAVDPIVSGGDGKAYICRCDEIQGLPMGTYTIRETRAPVGYDLPDYSYTFTVSHNGCITFTGTNSRTGLKEKMVFRDEPEVEYHAGGITIRKTNAEDETQELIGAVYGIYAASDITAASRDGNRTVTLYSKDEKVTELTTGVGGTASTGICSLPLGSYYLKEITAPAGFLKNDTVTEIAVLEENKLQEETVMLTDEPKRADAELVFGKEVLSAGHRLKAGQFTYDLYRIEFSGDASGDGNTRTLVGTTTNDAAGKIVFNSENTNGALSFSETEDLGHANFVCVERPDASNRYNCDTHEEFVELSLADDGVSEELVVTPMYGADIENLKTVPIYATEELIDKNYIPGMFRNCYRQPSDLPEPVKEVSGGNIITEKLHNAVRYGDSFTYDVLQAVPEEDESDYYKSFDFYDELPEGIRPEAGEDGNYEISVTADGTDVTGNFRISVDTKETEQEDIKRYIVKAEYSGDLKDPSVYGVTYDLCMNVTAAEEVTEPWTFTNFARVDIAYIDEENHYVLDDNGDVLKDADGNAFYETEADYSQPENPEDYAAEKTTDPLKAVHSSLTNCVETDIYPYIPDEDWEVSKHVYDTEGEEINTFAVQHEDTLIYKIDVRNSLGKTGGLVTVTDPLPEYVSYVDSDPEAQFDEETGLITWADVPVGAGETKTISFRVHVNDGGAFSAIDNKAHAAMRAEYYRTDADCEAAGLDVTSEKDTANMHNYVPSITKMVTDENGRNMNGLLVESGTELTYHIYVTNPDSAGEDPARTGRHTFTVRDEIPENTEPVGEDETKSLSWTAEYDAGETKEFVFRVRAVGKGVMIVNAAELLVPDETSDRSFRSNEVVNGIPMDPLKSVTTTEGKDVDRQFLEVGKTYRYTITVDNPTKAVKNYTITDKVPDHIKVENVENAGTYSSEDGTITWVIEAASEEKSTVSFTFHPTDKEAHFTNQGQAVIENNYPVEPLTGIVDRSGEDHTISENTNTVENWTPADPVKQVTGAGTSGTKNDLDGMLVFGENEDILIYKIRVKNTSGLAKTFTVTDQPDPDLTFVSAADEGRYDSDTGAVIWTVPLEAGEEKTVSFKAKVSAGNKTASADNTADVYVDDVHIRTNETNTGIDSTPVKTVLDAEGKNIDDFLINKGERLTYCISVCNPMTVTKHFTVTDEVPENTEFIAADKGESTSSSHKSDSSEVNTVSVSAGKTRVTWEADIPAGETYRFCFKVKASKQGAYIPNDAQVLVDNSSIRTNLVENWTPEDPLKAVTKDGADAEGETFTAGDETGFTYEILVKNPANVEKEFTVRDVLDGNLSFVSADNGGTCSGNTVTWNVKVGAGEEKKVTVNVRVIASPYGTKIDNKATVSCDLFSAETNKVTVYLRRVSNTSNTSSSDRKHMTAEKTAAESEDLAVRTGPETGDTGTGGLLLSITICLTSLLLLLYCLKRRGAGRKK